MLQGKVPSRQIEDFARRDGIDFKMTPEIERDMQKAGATQSLIQLLEKLSNHPVAAPAAGPSPDDPAVLLKPAEDALTRRDYEAARKAAQSVVDAHPEMAPAWFDLAFAEAGLHQTDAAVKNYQKTLELAPGLFPAQLNLGILLAEIHQPQAALEHLQKATELKPESVRAHLEYARALDAAGHPDDAAKEYQQVMHLNPHLASAPLELGQLELARNHPAEALRADQQALALDSSLTGAEWGAATACEQLDDTAGAIAHYEKYLAARPGDAKARLHLARLYLKQKQYDKAREAFESIYQVKPDLPGLTAELGNLNAVQKKYPEAEKYYRLALAAQPGVADLHRALGQTLFEQRKFQEAEKEFRAALHLDPHNRDAVSGLALSLQFQERYGEAIPLLEQLAQTPGAAPYTYFILATCYDHLQARKQALANYERFLQLSKGQNPDAEWQATQRAKLLRRVTSN